MAFECFWSHRKHLRNSYREVKRLIILSIEFKQSNCECNGVSFESVKPKSKRRNIMKSSTQDNAEGKMHRVKGKIKEMVGKAIKNPDLEAEGKEERRTSKIQEKIGKIKKVFGK
jgi:uncharacterized protein YjbJ (UPF0337 family)